MRKLVVSMERIPKIRNVKESFFIYFVWNRIAKIKITIPMTLIEKAWYNE